MDVLWKRLLDRPVVRILAAVLAAVPPFVLHQGLAHAYGYYFPPFLFYWPVIVAIALWFGFRAGLVTTLTGVALIDIWILSPAGGWVPVLAADAMGLILYMVLGMFLSSIAAGYRQKARRVATLESEQTLRASEGRFRAVLRESRDIMYRLNLKTGKYDYMSPATEAVMGYSSKEYLAMNAEQVYAMVHPDDLPQMQEQMKQAERDGRAEIEYRLRAKDGKYRWLSNLVFVEYDTDGTPLYREGNTRDITVVRESREALLRSAALASAGRLSAAIAHEINNPLTAVTNLLFLAQSSQDLPDPVRDYLTKADAELQRIGLITRRSLGFYRETETAQQVSIDALLESCVELFQRQLDQRRVQLVRDGESGVEVTAFGGELRQIFSNLLSNSLDAVAKAGTIRMRVRRGVSRKSAEPCIRIAVADNGHGIAEEARQQIFEAFFTTKGSVGTGLGLWVSAHLVKKNSGTIRMRSSSSDARHGTVFVVELPG